MGCAMFSFSSDEKERVYSETARRQVSRNVPTCRIQSKKREYVQAQVMHVLL